MRRIVPFLYYSRSGRRVVVYGKPEQLHRPNYGGREITEYRIPTEQSGPVGITTGADGALWFVQINGNQIGRITTAGEITEFKLPSGNARPHAITAGVSGDLWFTEWGANQIGRITCTGDITEYPIPTPPQNLMA